MEPVSTISHPQLTTIKKTINVLLITLENQ